MDASQSRDSLKAVLLFFSALLFAVAVRPGPQSAWLVLMGTVLIGVLTLSPSRASAPFVVDSQERWSFRLLMAVLAFGLLGVVGWVPSTIGPTTAQLERVPGAVWCLLALATFVTRRRANDVMRWGLVVLAVALTLAVGALHLRAAHGVGFDVLVFHIEAAQALAEGQNPWTDAVTVPDGSLNAEPGDVIVGYVYPPVTAIAYSVGYWVFSDPRVTSLLAWTGYLLVLGALAIRRRSTPGLLTMLLFAALPGWPLVLRAAWSEPLSLVLLAGAYAMWRSSAGSGLTTGLAMASKQYFFATAPLLLLHLVEQHGRQEVVHHGLGACVGFLRDQARIDPLHLFRDEAVLHAALRAVRLVVEGDWTQLHQGGARGAHVGDVVLDADRG